MKKITYGEIEITSLDELSPLPDISFKKIFGEGLSKYIQRVIISQPSRCNHATNYFLICHAGNYCPLTTENFLHKNEYFYFCIGKYVCKWNINLMKLEWDIELDMSCCFKIEFMDDGRTILVSGEEKLSRVDCYGNILWSFIGADIFVTEFGDYGAEIKDNAIYIRDWGGAEYILDFEGNVID